MYLSKIMFTRRTKFASVILQSCLSFSLSLCHMTVPVSKKILLHTKQIFTVQLRIKQLIVKCGAKKFLFYSPIKNTVSITRSDTLFSGHKKRRGIYDLKNYFILHG